MLMRAREKGILDIRCTDVRDFAENKHGKVDDRPFGGGPGMVMTPGPLARAIRHTRQSPKSHVIYLSPQGSLLNAARCETLAAKEHLIFVCGHYEGIDERVIALEIDEELSIGDYVLTSGCAAALVAVDAISRFVPGVIGDPDSVREDSFQEGIFDAPQYTRPEIFEGLEVPPILLGGHHAEIQKWRKQEALNKTGRVRPELVKLLKERNCEPFASH